MLKETLAAKSLENHRAADLVICVALGILACFVLVAFLVGGRYSGKNHEIEVKIVKETSETALACKESARSNDEMLRRRKVWSNGDTAEELENPKVPF